MSWRKSSRDELKEIEKCHCNWTECCVPCGTVLFFTRNTFPAPLHQSKFKPPIFYKSFPKFIKPSKYFACSPLKCFPLNFLNIFQRYWETSYLIIYYVNVSAQLSYVLRVYNYLFKNENHVSLHILSPIVIILMDIWYKQNKNLEACLRSTRTCHLTLEFWLLIRFSIAKTVFKKRKQESLWQVIIIVPRTIVTQVR